MPTKAKEDPSPHEMRLSPARHQPSISCSRGYYYYIITIIIIIIIIITIIIIIIIIIIIVIIIINTYLSSIYKYNGSSPYKLLKKYK